MADVTPPDPLPPDRNVGPVLVAVSTVLVFFAVLTGGLRLWVRFRYRSLSWDDYLMALVLPIAIIRLAIQGVQLEYGNGRHRWYISEEDYETNNMLGWYTQHTLFIGMCLLKCSIMYLLLRIKSTKPLRWGLGAAMVGLVITNLACVIILLSECRPISAYWTGEGECWDNRIRIYSIYFTISYSLLTDLVCSLLPLVVIWKVRIPLKTKLMVWALMSIGLIATGFGIARAQSLGTETADLSYYFAIVAIWSNMEFFLGIIAANIALWRQIYGYFMGKPEHSSSAAAAASYELGGTGRSNKPSALRSGHMNSRLRDDYHGSHMDNNHTLIESTRRPSATKSDGSDIPLEPGIQKKTEFWISDGEMDSQTPETDTPRGQAM